MASGRFSWPIRCACVFRACLPGRCRPGASDGIDNMVGESKRKALQAETCHCLSPPCNKIIPILLASFRHCYRYTPSKISQMNMSGFQAIIRRLAANLHDYAADNSWFQLLPRHQRGKPGTRNHNSFTCPQTRSQSPPPMPPSSTYRQRYGPSWANLASG